LKNLDDLVTCDVIAKKLGYHIQYVRDLARLGKLPATKRGRAWLFNETEVVEYLQDQDKKRKETYYGRRADDGAKDGSDLLQ